VLLVNFSPKTQGGTFMHRTKITFIAAMAALAGCVAAPKITSTFNPSEAAFIHQQGKGSIKGQAFLRRNDGMVVYAAGSDVFLIPKTTYSSERMAALYRGGKMNKFVPSPEAPPGYAEAARSTKANGEGRFEFSSLADGDYFVVTQVQWMVGNLPQGGALMEPVSMRNGAAVEIIMTGQ
jgi:hypothetical protein